MVGFNHGGVGGIPAKRKKGNAFLHLAKFTAVQQLALFAPNVEITLERIEKDTDTNFASWIFEVLVLDNTDENLYP